ncbi:MAG: hypothetical protein RRZ42_07680 [Oscillospiraceae bacterium]
MKGLNRKVIEIVETNSDFIDRVIVILKPGVSGVGVRNNNEQIEGYLSNLICRKKHTAIYVAGGIAAALALLALILIVLI